MGILENQNDFSSSDIVGRYAGIIWSTADVLRGVGAKSSEWPNHMMPFFALMLLESRALRASNLAKLKFTELDFNREEDREDFKTEYRVESGRNNTTFNRDLVYHGHGLAHIVSGGPSGFHECLKGYLGNYDESTQTLLGVDPARTSQAYLDINRTIGFLSSKGGEHLWLYCKKWSEVNLEDYDSSAITTLEEHIKRRWADISAETAGEHYTPADLIDLVADIAIDHFTRHPIKNHLRIYDPTCGGGNMLYGVEDRLRASKTLLDANGSRYSFHTYGQELNDSLYALASIESRFRKDAKICLGNTLTDDKFDGEVFELIVANPPYGTDWKQVVKDVEADKTGRFPSGCRPPVSDGQHLFLQHIYKHMADDGLALVFCSGSTLFSGDAGGGESNARSKYIMTDDGVWGIIQLPKNEFFNTGINTYVWVFKKCKPESMERKLFLLNAETLFSKMRKSLGSKNSEITNENRQKIVSLIRAAEDMSIQKHLLANPNSSLTISENGGEVIIRDKEHESANEPEHLKLLHSDSVHYNKVFIEITRGGKNGPIQKDFVVKEAKLSVDGSAYIESGLSVQDFIGRVNSALNSNFENFADASKALKEACQNGSKVNADASEKESYLWDSEERELVGLLGNNQIELGRASLDLKISKKSSGDAEQVVIAIGFKTDIEKDFEKTSFSSDRKTNDNLINNFLNKWIEDKFEIDAGKSLVGCEINFNSFFPKAQKIRTVQEIDTELQKIELELRMLADENLVVGG